MNEFEKESATMDMKEEMMSEAVDDVMEDEAEDEEEEGDKILREVLDEMGVGLQHQVSKEFLIFQCIFMSAPCEANRCTYDYCHIHTLQPSGDTRWGIRK